MVFQNVIEVSELFSVSCMRETNFQPVIYDCHLALFSQLNLHIINLIQIYLCLTLNSMLKRNCERNI